MFAGMYMKLIAAAIVIAAIMGGVWYVKNLQGKVQTLTAEKIVLETQISTQNAAIETFKLDSEKRLKTAEDLLKTAKLEAEKNKTNARVIYKKSPSTPGDNCKSALDLVNGGAK